MKLFPFRGRSGRTGGAARRRAARFATPMPESLESRALLSAGPLGINVDISPYASFVNWLQTPGSWGNAPDQSNTLVMNASGDPESDASLLFDLRVNQPWNGPDPNAVPPNLSGTYSLSFNGQATIQSEYPGFSTPFTVQNQVYNAATNTTTASLVVPADYYSEFFAILFLNTQATPTSAVGTGFSNAKLIRPGYDANSTQLYTNEFLSALAPYSVIRYLNTDGANDQQFFNGTTLVTVDAPQVDQTGLPWEYEVALANQTNTDMWINVPEGATNAYVTALAGIIKNGGTVNGVSYPGLNPNLKVYLEYSNEVWGGIPYNYYYQQAAVQNGADNMPLSTFPSNLDVYNNPDGTTTTDYDVAAGRRYLERTNDISQIFQSVLGSDPTHQRIRPVLGWQEDNLGFFGPALNWFEHFFGPASSAFYGIGDANYWGPTDYSSVDAAIASMAAQETSYSIPDTTAFTALATSYGLKNVSYEGGPSISGQGDDASNAVALATSRDPRMEQLVYQHYVDFYQAGGALGAFFDGPFGTWSPDNEWDAAEMAQYGNPSASPKYQGTVDVANAAPVAVTAGIQVSATTPTTFPATSDGLYTDFSTPATGQQGYWLLNVASAGSYDLNLTTAAGGGTAPGQIEVFLNDTLIGGPINVSASSTVDLGNLPLSAGLNGLSIVAVHGVNDPSQSDGQYYLFQPTALTLAPGSAPPPSSSVTASDAGFELLSLGTGPGAYQYAPAGSPWAFSAGSATTGGAGIAGNGSDFTSANPDAPDGTQVAFLQAGGSVSQSVSGWQAGTYQISFEAAQRGNAGPSNQSVEVLVDGAVVGTVDPSGTAYQAETTSSFTVAAGTHTIEFLGLSSSIFDTAFIDSIAIL